jgi:hypothetical protein
LSNLKAKNRLIKLINILKIKWNPHPSIGLKIQIKSKEKKNLFEVWYTSYNKIKVLNHLNYTSFSKTNTFTLKITFLLLKYKKTIFFFCSSFYWWFSFSFVKLKDCNIKQMKFRIYIYYENHKDQKFIQ